MDVARLWATLIDRMRSDDPQRVSWTVRHDRRGELERELLGELLQVCKDACAAEFSEADGYTTSIRRLSGALDGGSIEITRTGLDERRDFRALISIQRYVRTQAASAAEIRIVAACRHESGRSEDDDGHARGGALSRWGSTGCALGTIGVGAAGLELSGLLATWGQALLLIPLLMAWRVFMAIGIVTDARREQANRQLAEDSSVAYERERARRRDGKRWQRVTEILLAQREAVAERFALQPFRSPGAQAGSVGARGVTTPAVLPPAVLPVPALPT